MDMNMLRRALWVFLRPLLQLVTNLLNPEIGEEWLEELKKFLRKEPTWVAKPTPTSPKWREENGVIYFSVTSNGRTGEEWITWFDRNNLRSGNIAKQLLRSQDFKPTLGVTTNVAVLKGMLFEDNVRMTSNIRLFAEGRKFSKPNAEVACLIREKFTDEEIESMGLWWIVAMHEPIDDSGSRPLLLGANRSGDGRCLSAFSDGPSSKWPRENGFAFAVSQVSTQT